MVIAVVGRTDKRPVIYTLMKLFQSLGDCCVLTQDRHFRRLIEDTDGYLGHIQNIMVSVSDASPDEIFVEMGYRKTDFEFIIYDCIDLIPDESDLVIWVGGADGMTEDDETLLSMYPGHKEINLGFGKNAISYTVDMFKACETIEGLKHFVLPNQQIAQRLASFLTTYLNMSATNILKVVTKK